MLLSPPNLKITSGDRSLMLFDLALGGHHGSYIQYLLEYWYEHNLSGKLNIVVLPEFLDVHHDTVEFIAQHKHPNIQLLPIKPEEKAALASRSSGMSRALCNFQEWRLFCNYAAELRAEQCLMMYLDTYELPLALGLKAPCPFSGIYFRPTFHYKEFFNYTPSSKVKLQQAREKFALSRILRHPQLATLFCLDPFAVKQLEKLHNQANIVHLPDPIKLDGNSGVSPDVLKKRLCIQPDRQVLLLFGALEGRKGIYQLIEAIALLSPALCEKLCLLLVGGTNPTERALIASKVQALRQDYPIQIIEQYEFVPEQEVAAYFQLADVVLAPYQHHAGMSGILLHAAAAGKPVLSSDYGLMGELVQRHKLGLAIDSAKPQEIAIALTRLAQEPLQSLYDREQIWAFAEQHSVDYFTKTIFHCLEKQSNSPKYNQLGRN